MADPVIPSSETPNQPAVETPVAVTPVAAPAVPPPASTPTANTPNPPLTSTIAAGATDGQAQALADAAAAKVTTDAAAAVAAAVPETYNIKPPAGMTLDPELIPALTPALKAAGLTTGQLQTVAEAFLKFQGDTPTRMAARDLEVTAKDPVLGGMNYAQTQKHVNLALDAFADPQFKQFVSKSGIGNRLEFVRVFQRIGEAMARAGDSPNRSQPDAAPETTRAQRLYGRTAQH